MYQVPNTSPLVTRSARYPQRSVRHKFDASHDTHSVPRKPRRISYPGAIYHVFTRAVDGIDPFPNSVRQGELLEIMDRVCRKDDWRVLAYCAMTNHYHFVVRTNEPSISAGMHRLNVTIANRWNARNDEWGHVFKNPFGSNIIESDEYFENAVLYVLLNPVAAGIVRHPAHWSASSYHATIGEAEAPWYLETTSVIERIGGDVDRFIKVINARIPYASTEIPSAPERRRPLDEILDQERVHSVLAAVDEGYRLVDIAAFWHISLSTLSRRMKRAGVRRIGTPASP